MTADLMFSLASNAAMAGWLVLAFAVFRRNDWLRDRVAGFWWPLVMACLYTLLILLFFGGADGGYDSLANVKLLFTSDWVALAGWVHYLAFDLFIGAWIARQVMTAGMNRLWLVPILPATFLFGPAGLLAFAAAQALSQPVPAEESRQ